MKKLPEFPFHPNVYLLGLFDRVTGSKCTCCKEDSEYLYKGPFYTEYDDVKVCPWCISDGRASEKYNGVFQSSVDYKGTTLMVSYDSESRDYMYLRNDEIVEPITDDNLNTLLFRTPSYVAWQEPHWMSHCGELCIFMGYLEIDELEGMREKLQEDISKYESMYGTGIRNLALSGGLYLFQCTACYQLRLHLDVS